MEIGFEKYAMLIIKKGGKRNNRRKKTTKIRRGIFQGDALSPLLFVIKKCTGVYKLHKSQKDQTPNGYGRY